ncbi:tryptophan transporter [Thermosediminibacter oceani]|uniref:Tryptophan transport protein n=1 Tax=Thermosediminibacter oceani (strain ATCC BAA-1034 / DSM 16646 / JW/IW-1228P) TaxID=555079 RepID=D9RZG1_THEOJ|nr:tryptophan transporter [Thermosediminibacter oceani]ADL06859.1 tryptophan transport protein [Thermosediminibacter oceani DSM 16646]
MKLKDMILTSLLMAIGLVFHQITPPLVAGMKPDFLLTMLFVALFINPAPKNALLAGMVGGIFAALTTSFPGGQVANIADRIITAQVVALLIRRSRGVSLRIFVPLTGLVGTILSGTVFLLAAMMVMGALPAAFPVLFTAVVLPTAAINSVVTGILYGLVTATGKVVRKI